MFNKKQTHFKTKIGQVKRSIWDLEFKRFKTRELRESMRQEFDGLKSRIAVLEAQIKSEKDKPTLKKEEAARLDDQKVLMERDRDRLLDQIKALDLELEGSEPSSDMPQGYQGIAQQLDGFRELYEMLKDYTKTL